MMMNFALILNPSAFSRHSMKLKSLTRLLDHSKVSYAYFKTVDAASITTESRRALELGYTHILPIGGDGTLSLAAKAFMEKDKNLFPDATLVPLDFGSGHDFYNGFIPKPYQGRFDWFVENAERVPVSLGTFVSGSKQRYFLNSFSIGISSRVLAERAGSRIRQGKVSYLLASLKAIPAYKTKRIEVNSDSESVGGPTLLLLLSNGPYVGGGMKLVKKADPESAHCEALWIPALPLYEIAKNLPKIYQGRVDEVKGVRSFRFKALNCNFEDEENFVEADGELCAVNQLLSVRILPGVIHLLRPRA